MDLNFQHESLDALLERRQVQPEIRQQIRDKGFSTVVRFAGAINEDELIEWFIQPTQFHASIRAADNSIIDWPQELPQPREHVVSQGVG